MKWEKTGICPHHKKPVGLTVKTVRSTGFFAYLHTLFSYNRVAIWGAIV